MSRSRASRAVAAPRVVNVEDLRPIARRRLPRVVFDYLDASVVAGTTTLRGAVRARAAVAKRGESYQFGLTRDGAADFVRSYGFAVEQNLSITDLASRFGGPPGFPYSTDDFFGVITATREPR